MRRERKGASVTIDLERSEAGYAMVAEGRMRSFSAMDDVAVCSHLGDWLLLVGHALSRPHAGRAPSSVIVSRSWVR